MKKLILLFALALVYMQGFTQTTVYSEGFETLPLSVTSSGNPGWARSNVYAMTGTFSDSSRVAQADTSYLTTASFSTAGNTFVILEFAHICKIEAFDGGIIEVSNNGGLTWTKLVASQYLGTGQFGNQGDRFTAVAYPMWDPGNGATIPQNAWWRKETFNISSVAANSADVRIRFKLYDGNNNGHNGNYGWLIDDIKVTVQPYLNDLVLKDILTPEGDECYNGNEIVSVLIGNIGTDPVNTPFTASYKLGNNTPVNETVNVTIQPGDSIIYTFTTPISFTLQGNDSTMYLKTYVAIPVDPYLTNDTLGKDIKFLYTPPSPLADHDTIVYGNTATLGAISANNIKWYATPSSTTVLDTGATFTTPVLYGSKAYYASASAGSGSGFVGPANNTIGAGGATNLTTYFTIFDVLSPTGVTIKNVDIYPGVAAGAAFTMVVQNASLQTIATYNGVTTVASGSKQTVNVNFNVPFGSNYRIGFTTMPNLYRNTAGATFPYTLPGIISITGQTFSGYPQYYYYVYNWEVSSGSGCESPRTEVWAVVTGNPPVDAGVISIDQPISPTNLQTQNVHVSIQNYGTNPLTSVTINWTNNGITQLAHQWNGNLPTNQTASVNIGSFTPTLGNNNIVAWVSNPNGVIDPMPLNDTASKIINAFDPLNGIYTIGGTNPNFNNFATAQYALANYGVSGPVTFKVRSGTYNEKLLLPAYNGASATNTVKIMPDAGATVILSVSDTFTVRINNAMYYTIDGSNNGTNSRDFSIINNSTNTNTAAIWISGTTDYITLKNLNIAAGSNTVVSTFGIHAGGASITTSATGNNNNLTLQNNVITKSYFGIYARAAATARNNNLLISGNIIGSNAAADFVTFRGVDVQGAVAPIIEKNEIFNLKLNTSVNIAGIDIGQDVTDAKLRKNRIRGIHSTSTGGWGAYGINISSATNTSGIEISNNFISDIKTINYSLTSTVYNAFGIRITGGTNHKIFHNSVNLYGPIPSIGTSTSMSAALLISVATATGMDIRNNIFANSTSGLTGSKHYTVYAISGTTFSQINYNNYFVSGPHGVLAFGGSDRPTLTDWKTFTTQDVNSVNINPAFINPDNLYTFSATLNNLGTPISNIPDDIDGNPRNLTTPDMGATEFSPIDWDMGVVQILSPLSNCGIGNATTMSIRVKNFGLNTITTFNVSYTINGAATVTETFNGSLATDSTITYTFATTADLSANIAYNIKYKVILSGDQFAQNDSMLININPKHDFYSGAYFMGFEAAENMTNWTVLDVNNDGRKWEPGYNSTTYAKTGSQSARFFNSSTLNGNDWLITPCFTFESGNTYEISFWYRVESATYPQRVALLLGNDIVPLAFTDTLVNLVNFANTTYQKATALFSVSTTGVYYLGWHATSNAANYYAFIDDINIKMLPPQEAALVAMPLPLNGCDLASDTVRLKIANTGGSIINGNLTASYQVAGSPNVVTENVTGTINVGDTLQFNFATLVDLSTVVDSNFVINAWINLTGDPFTFNDSLSKSVESLITPSIPITTPDTVNYGQQAQLIASSNGALWWFNSMASQVPIFNGDTLITPNLFSTTTYYVEASNSTLQTTGMPAALTTATSGAGTTNFGLVFDVFSPTLLKSVTVYPVSASNASGTVTIDIINSSGTILHTTTANVIGSPAGNPSPHVIPLNFNLQPGTNLKMRPGYTGISGLLFEPSANAPNGNYGFPYIMPGILSINTSTLTAHPTNTARNDLYYYFYNWEVGAPGCTSNRVPVEAYVILPQYEPGVVAITSPVNEDCSDNTEIVTINISNSGSNDITTNLTATYVVNNATPVTENVNITIPSGDTVAFTFATPINLNLTTGDTILNIKAYVNHPSDPYQVNDTINQVVKVFFTPPAPIAVDATVPYGTSATVGALSPNSLIWYTTPSSTVVLDTGATYTTPVLYGNTPYYVSAAENILTLQSMGMPNAISTASFITQTAGWGLFFSCNEDILIDYVHVYPTGTGTITIQILDSVTNTVFWSAQPVNITGTGSNKVKVPVNLTIPAGTYKMGMQSTGITNLIRESSGATHPYIAPSGNARITAGATGSATPSTGTYYWFYDWGVSTPNAGCESPRTEVWAYVTGNPAVDAGVISVDLPLSPTNLQLQNAHVTIQNFGTDPLTSVTINWMNNGVLQTPFNWAGSLTTSQTAQVNIGAFTPVLGNNNLVAWTSNPNGVTDPMLLNDTASAVIEAFEPLCGLLTIGGTNANFATFADALYALNNYGVSCPVVFKVNPGSYPERIVLGTYTGVSATNTITFEGQPGAIINYEPTTTNDRAVILLNGAQYIKLDSLIVNIPASATFGFGIHVTGASSNIQITNCTVNTNATSSSTNYAGIVASGSITSATTTGNSANNLLIQNNMVRGGYYGISVVGASATTLNNIKIFGNKVEDTYYYGIYTYYLNMPELRWNDIRMRSTGTVTTSNHGLYVYFITGPFFVTHNKITNAGLYGINVTSSNAATNKSIIANNMIGGGFQNLTSTSTSGIYITSSANIGLYYNSINMDAPAGNALYTLSTATQLDIRNNSFAYTGGASGYAFNIATTTNQTHLNYNNYYSNGSKFVKYSTDRANLAALIAANSPLGNDTASRQGNPNYYSNTNLHALTMQLYQGGTPIAGITDDFDGDLRDAIKPCIGADEYAPANIDASPIALVSPSSACGLSNAEQISVLVTNSGLNTFNTISISYSVNNGVPVNQTFNQTVLSNATDTFSFTTPYDFSAYGIYTIKVITHLTGDQVSFNDTLIVIINTGHDLSVSPYTMGFEANEDATSWTKLDVNSDGNTWAFPVTDATYARTGTNIARYNYNLSNAANDWMFSPCFALEAGRTYKIEFWYRVYSASYPENLALKVGNDNTPAAMTTSLVSLQGFTNTTYQLAQTLFTPTADGSYYFGWHAFSAANMWNIYVDDINIRLLEARDAAVVAINNLDDIVNGASVITPEVKIKNYGSDTLVNIPVKYTVNGGTPVTETWMGTLLPDSTVNYTFTTGFTAPSGNFTFCAYTQLSNDGNTSNDTTCQTSFGIPLLSIPYADDFEGPVNFYTVGANNQWQHGVPNASVINSAYSPTKAWATNLTGNYNASSNYNLLTPRFNFINTTNVVLKFWHWKDSELDTDGGRIQYTTNNGNTWLTLGVVGDPLATNWYNSSNINGAPAFTGQSGTWVQSTYDLSQFNNFPAPIQFRFNFFANASVQANGWAIDNFELVQANIPQDAGVIAINNPPAQVVTGSSQTVQVTIKNYGTDTLTAIPVRYRINNGVPVAQQWTGVLAPGDSTDFTFTTPVVQTASYSLCAWTRIPADIYQQNDTTCKDITIIPAQYDAGVIEIITPAAQTVIAQPVTVSVKIKNFGTEPLTSIGVSYDINSGTPVVDTWTGNLAPNAEAIFNFTQTYLSPGGNYQFCAQTTLSNDQNATNNKMCKTVSGTTGINDGNYNGLILEQNVPNPASNSTVFTYTLPKAGSYNFKITNALGQIVYSESDNKDAGTHRIEMEVISISNGIYFYSLEFDGILLVRRMIIN